MSYREYAESIGDHMLDEPDYDAYEYNDEGDDELGDEVEDDDEPG